MTHLSRSGFLLVISVLTIQAFTQDYNFRNFSTENGLTQSYVYSIMQDVHGYLWVGTEDGLSRYNGFVFENYKTDDSLADNFTTCSILDGKNIWFGHMNGSFSYYNGKIFKAIRVPQQDAGSITHFSMDPDGQIWASSSGGRLIKLDKAEGVVKQFLFRDQVCITSFEFISHNELLVGANSGLLFCRLKETGEIEIIRPVEGIPESKITCIQKMKNNSGFYLATENDGVYQLIHENNQFKVIKIVGDQDLEFTGIQDILEDSNSDLWLCTFGSGLIKMSFSTPGRITGIEYYNKTNGFTADNVKTIYEDPEGNIWSGNYGMGLTLIIPRAFSLYKFDNPLVGNNVFSICFNQQYRWIGMANGLAKLDQITGQIVKFYGKENGLPNDTVTSIYSRDGKELWIGTGRNGVFRMEAGNGKIIKHSFKNGSLENSITSITGKDKQIWIGTKKGLFNFNSSTGKIAEYSIHKGGLPHNYINYLYIDRTGRLWVCTASNSLVYIQGEKVFKVPFNSGSEILTITEDNDSRIWVGSNGNGVFMIDSDSVANLTVNERLLTNYCYSLICDANNNIWVGHKGGLSRIRKVDFAVKPIQNMEGITDNYQFYSNAIIKDQEGIIWFGSNIGLVSYDPLMDFARFLPPVLGITSIKINDQERDYSDRIILSPGTYKIQIDFLGISLKEPALVTYQHKLEGYEEVTETSKSTSITYNRLTEGEYTFILYASSGEGAVSENPLTISIIIKKPVWKKWWFYVVIVLLMIMMTFFYIKRREYSLLAKNQLLEEKVLERTYEIQCQKNEIELQRDIIDKKNANIISSITYASHIQNAVLPPIELMDNLLPDSFILSKPKDIVSGDFYWLTEKNNKIVFAVADCTGHGVPGAFMSFMGITLLNEIVIIEGNTSSDVIVTNLRERMTHILQQNRKDNIITDGLDLTLCILDRHQKKIEYTGAMNDLVYIHNGKLEVLMADHLSVNALYGASGNFTRKEMEYKKGDMIYLFSDGYQDQFGGDHDKKYLRRRFFATLLEIYTLPMMTQKEILEKNHREWRKDTNQTDDITVMGIRL